MKYKDEKKIIRKRFTLKHWMRLFEIIFEQSRKKCSFKIFIVIRTIVDNYK